jgi:hypothetical protein
LTFLRLIFGMDCGQKKLQRRNRDVAHPSQVSNNNCSSVVCEWCDPVTDAMETTELLSLLEDLEDNIDDLEESLEPLLAAALSVTTKKLPLLDRAKLYTVLVYSIESLLFCITPLLLPVLD